MEVIKNALLGLAIGDALGVPVEFSDRKQRGSDPVVDMRGYGTHNQPPGTWSDDTSMTIATMDAIITEKGINYNTIMNNFSNWCNKAKYTATDSLFDIGFTCCRAISNYTVNNFSPIKCGLSSFDSNGNGSLMRIMPIAFYAEYNHLNDNELYELVCDISSLTHAHNISKLGCYIYIQFLIRLIRMISPEDSYREIKDINYSLYFDDDSIDKYNRILKNNIDQCDISEIKSSGYIVDTLESVFWCILNNNNYSKIVLQAVNLGGDTDTIAAIAGAAGGIIYGDSIPDEWIKILAKHDYLSEIAMKFEQVIKKEEI